MARQAIDAAALLRADRNQAAVAAINLDLPAPDEGGIIQFAIEEQREGVIER